LAKLKARGPKHRGDDAGPRAAKLSRQQKRGKANPALSRKQRQTYSQAERSEEQPVAAQTAAMIYVSDKHRDALAKLGFTVKESTDNLQGCNVVIIDAGERAEEIAKSLYGVAASVRILDLGDVSVWFKTDPAGVNLAKLAKAAPLWKPDDSGDTDDSADNTDRSDGSGPDPTNALNDDDEEGDDGNADERLIAELAALGPLQYAKRKKEAAQKIGITVADLQRGPSRRSAVRLRNENRPSRSMTTGTSSAGMNRSTAMYCCRISSRSFVATS
jgi:hypothetical protein